MLSIRASHPLAVAIVLALAACGKNGGSPYAYTAPSAATHLKFPIGSGPHAVDCTQCHGTFPSFSQFDCLGCHTQAPTAAVHTTTSGYAYDSPSCYTCHADPAAHPFDHKSITTCASCHASGAAYAALPVAGFTHLPLNGADCSQCHATGTWLSTVAPTGLVADPAAAVAVNALVARYSGTSIVQVSPQLELLPMPMNHATTSVNVAGLPCGACHADASAGVFYPGFLHSSLANLSQPAPTTCGDCHATSPPTGFVGPTAASPSRTPASGEMKHDAVLWSADVPTGTRVVTADCGSCHLSPVASQARTWATSRSGTSPALYHAALTAAGLPQPASCLDCHANSRPVGVVTVASAGGPTGLTFDHLAASATGDCAACHGASTTAWSSARFHLAGSATPVSCLPCHAGERPTSSASWTSPGYASHPFDYGTNPAGITHGDGQDCVSCHAGPGTSGTWAGTQTFTGGHFTHGPTTVSATTCIACHMTQRPDLVLGAAPAATALGFDHAAGGTGDCLGCHVATVTAGTYVNYFGAGGTLPGGDWQGGVGYPGTTLVSASNQFVTVTEISLIRPTPGGLATGMSSVQATLYNAMLHTSTQVPAPISAGTSATGDPTQCWHCHTHVAGSTTITSYLNGQFHSALSGYSATVGGAVTPLPQPTSGCLDCHAQMRPGGIVELAASDLQPMDHAATFVGTPTIAGQTVGSVAGLDCSACHHGPGTSWTDGRFHVSIGSAVPADCTACHYPLMADGARANLASGTSYAMAHGSQQLTFQACATCHTAALAGSTVAPSQSTAWRPGAYHASLPSQPTGCVDCHAVSEPAAGASTQSSWSYVLAAGGTGSNGGQWMNHGAASVVGLDCFACHAADARTSGSAWNKADLLHAVVPAPTTCQACHGLANGGGAVAGTNNNLPAGLTDSTTLTTASASTLTGVAAGTHDQISHADINASGHDCNFCHTQVGRSTATGIQGKEWAQARFHASFSSGSPLLINGTTGRCSTCHLNVKPGPSYTAQDHSAFTAASGTQDCSACHSWPGAGGSSAPDWKGGGQMPQFITVGGFPIPNPPATTATTQAGIANLPHPTVASGTACTACHTGAAGGRPAIGYDHASALISSACSACHEIGSTLVGSAWNGATAQASGAGDTRPISITSLTATRGSGGSSCTIPGGNHFYPVQCGQCHSVPSGNGLVTTGTAYSSAWTFPHSTSKMANPGTCNLCHAVSGCPKD